MKRRPVDSDSPAAQTLKKSRQSQEPDVVVYSIVDGYRHVLPYATEFNCFAKLRWLGRLLVEVFSAEFCYESLEYYRNAIATGAISVNGKCVDVDEYRIRNGDLIVHRRLHTEPAVRADPIKVVYEDDSIVAIDKPSSIPVHPSGRYRYNTVTNIMKYEMGYSSLFTVHRLDRLTSGIMIFAKSAAITAIYADIFVNRHVHKVYYARVRGNFSFERVAVDQPLSTACPRISLNVVDRLNGKRAKTVFERVAYCSSDDTTLVKCTPETGRTHQIRVHLRYLGHPIANDPLYLNPILWKDEDDELVPMEEMKRRALLLADKRAKEVSRCDNKFETLWLHANTLEFPACKDTIIQCTLTATSPHWVTEMATSSHDSNAATLDR